MNGWSSVHQINYYCNGISFVPSTTSPGLNKVNDISQVLIDNIFSEMKLFHFYKTFSSVCFKQHDWWLCVNIGTRYDHKLTHKRRQLFIKLRMSVFTDCITVSTGYNIPQNIIVWQKMQRMNSNRFNNPPSKLDVPFCEPNEKIGWSAIWCCNGITLWVIAWSLSKWH